VVRPRPDDVVWHPFPCLFFAKGFQISEILLSSCSFLIGNELFASDIYSLRLRLLVSENLYLTAASHVPEAHPEIYQNTIGDGIFRAEAAENAELQIFFTSDVSAPSAVKKKAFKLIAYRRQEHRHLFPVRGLNKPLPTKCP
jgi:hypothetical protein